MELLKCYLAKTNNHVHYHKKYMYIHMNKHETHEKHATNEKACQI